MKEFRTNFNSAMCYVEDVYHTRCSHWADQPRLYHACPSALGTGHPVRCFNEKKYGAAQDDSLCQRCKTHSGRDTGSLNTLEESLWLGSADLTKRLDSKLSVREIRICGKRKSDIAGTRSWVSFGECFHSFRAS